MKRREFLAHTGGAALWSAFGSAPALSHGSLPRVAPEADLNLNRHRFGVNYTPSHDWWFCWNDWKIDPIKRDLDALANLGVDHLRIFPIWPYFQPNATWVSPAHIGRLDQLLMAMGERNLDALVAVFTGQLSGPRFWPSFNRVNSEFYTDPSMWAAQELYVRELAHLLRGHRNVIGFDFGNEVETAWNAPLQVGDQWMTKMFNLMNSALPGRLHVNGTGDSPWLREFTFSPHALALAPLPVMHAYPYWAGSLKYGGPMDPPSTRLLAAFAALIRSYAGSSQKPVWAGEFNTCIETMDERQQAKWLEVAVEEAIHEGVCWFTYWDSHDTDRKFKFNSLEYTLGLFTNEGRMKEQAKVFKKIIETYQGQAVAIPAETLPPPPSKLTMDDTWKWLLEYLQWKPKAGA